MNQTTYAGASIVGGGEPHLGGNVKEGDPYTFSPRVWSYVIERFCVQSVLDLGSGIGNAADYFFRKGLRTVAVEGVVENVRESVYPAICHDLTRAPVITKVDLVHCQEVVEHIEEQFLENVLRSLACGRVILMTHALPGQTGYHHVNLQPMDYWVKHISNIGYSLMVEDTNRIRSIAQQERAVYLQNSGLLFHRK
ncbi:MAG: methyltransferase domain-containing protein [Hyphomicrobiales bacterium]|nr:methyltransferase domain-containing protein [Hyphomicrobiales bacterium]